MGGEGFGRYKNPAVVFLELVHQLELSVDNSTTKRVRRMVW